MYKPARIAAVLALASLLAAVPARALSLKDWEAKSDRDQINYLGACVMGLVAGVEKTDRPLALRIKSYYGDKAPGQKYTDGTGALLTSIFSLLNQAKTDRRVDPAKIEIEDIVLRTTAEKFKLPNAVVNTGKNSGPGTPAPAKPDFQPADNPRPAVNPAPRPAKTADDPIGAGGFITPPVRAPEQAVRKQPVPAGVPIMVGKVDVSHIAGLKPGDAPQRVVSLYGQAVTDNGIEKWYGGARLMVRYADNVIKRVEVYSSELDRVRSRVGNDALLDLFGQSEAAVIALLGPPKWRESQNGGRYDLYWSFPMAGKPAGNADNATDQTLALEFGPGSGCFRVSVMW
jgi:hypothetical protein